MQAGSRTEILIGVRMELMQNKKKEHRKHSMHNQDEDQRSGFSSDFCHLESPGIAGAVFFC